MTPQEIINQWHMEQPSPLNRDLKVGEYPMAVKMATLLKFGSGHVDPSEAGNFWKEYQALNAKRQGQGLTALSPEDFTTTASSLATHSFAYHGRPPTMAEIGHLHEATPSERMKYYGSLPDKHYPTLTAHEMARSLTTANEWAQHHLGRSANKGEAHYLHHSGEHPDTYYTRMKGSG
jgi:hypothetical protein